MSKVERLGEAKGEAENVEETGDTIYAWRYRRQGPAGFKVGRHLRYRQTDVDRWISERIQDEASLDQQAHEG